MKFLLLSEVESIKCKSDALGTCNSVSTIYVMDNRKLCILELYKEEFEKKESISNLLGTNISDWVELWKPLVQDFRRQR